jgi:periplasmic protein TonB
MKSTIAYILAAIALAGCASRTADKAPSGPTRTPDAPSARSGAPAPASGALTLAGYKRDAALRIANANAAKVYSGRPQALLRSVVVVKYVVDANGQVVRSEILRSNHDRATETTALQSLRSASPLPRPASHLLRNGQLESVETWLFNNDGRFQLRTIAEPQMDN